MQEYKTESNFSSSSKGEEDEKKCSPLAHWQPQPQTLWELLQSQGSRVVNLVMLPSMWTCGKNTVDTWVKITEEAKAVVKYEYCSNLLAEALVSL